MVSSASWEVAYCKIKKSSIISIAILAIRLMINVSVLTKIRIVGGTEDAAVAIPTTGISNSSPG